jgi:hypothetical protein
MMQAEFIQSQEEKTNSPAELLRTFKTGATRSPLGDKLEYKGYLNPMVLKRYAEYMKKHQTQSDRGQRAADNWQKGIDLASLYDSKIRHDMDIWLYSEGYYREMTEVIEESLCASIFNTMAILKQVLEQNAYSDDCDRSEYAQKGRSKD